MFAIAIVVFCCLFVAILVAWVIRLFRQLEHQRRAFELRLDEEQSNGRELSRQLDESRANAAELSSEVKRLSDAVDVERREADSKVEKATALSKRREVDLRRELEQSQDELLSLQSEFRELSELEEKTRESLKIARRDIATGSKRELQLKDSLAKANSSEAGAKERERVALKEREDALVRRDEAQAIAQFADEEARKARIERESFALEVKLLREEIQRLTAVPSVDGVTGEDGVVSVVPRSSKPPKVLPPINVSTWWCTVCGVGGTKARKKCGC